MRNLNLAAHQILHNLDALLPASACSRNPNVHHSMKQGPVLIPDASTLSHLTTQIEYHLPRVPKVYDRDRQSNPPEQEHGVIQIDAILLDGYEARGIGCLYRNAVPRLRV